jgi:hypothetical protein
MKHLALATVLAFFMGAGSLALAQSTAAPPANHPHPRIREVRVRMHDQLARIKAGVKSGKLTKDQAQALRASLKAVRVQMQADFSTNGSKELTPDQLVQLNQMLDANSKTIYGEKHDTDSTSPTGSTGSTSSTGSAGTSSAPPAGN